MKSGSLLLKRGKEKERERERRGGEERWEKASMSRKNGGYIR